MQISDKIRKELDQIIPQLKKKKKKIILTTNAPEFPLTANYSLIDRFLLSNQRLPNQRETFKLKSEYYNTFANNNFINSINKFLKSYANENNIIILNRSFYLCNEKAKTCEFLTDKNKKILFSYGHYTVDGAKYLGKQIFQSGWFNTEK